MVKYILILAAAPLMFSAGVGVGYNWPRGLLAKTYAELALERNQDETDLMKSDYRYPRDLEAWLKVHPWDTQKASDLAAWQSYWARHHTPGHFEGEM